MLSKIFKQDYKATSRLFIPMFLAFAALSIINKIFFEIGISSAADNQFFKTIPILFMSIYVIGAIAIYVVSYVFIIMHFYKTMTGDQAYLTYTVPAKTSTIINSKLLISILWQLVTYLLIGLSIFLLIIGHVTSSDWYYFLELLNNLEIPLFKFGLQLLLIFIVGLVSSPLMFYASIAIGHLSQKHRFGASIISYFCIYFIIQVISSVFSAFIGIQSIKMQSASDFLSIYNTSLIFALLLSLVTTVIFYVITHYIFDKKLNLE